MASNFLFKILDISYKPLIIPKIRELNPTMDESDIADNIDAMFKMESYRCFGIFDGENLLGISSGWITVRFYSGRQLEVDNVIVSSQTQSKGIGKIFFKFIEEWAKENGCKSVELNTYVSNSRSHKFYFNNGYSILGFHFIKKI